MMIKCIIVDDESMARKVLQNLCEEYCDNVKVSGCAASVDEAIPLIKEHQPDLVFLDIRMPMKDGFVLLDAFQEKTFHVIFTTAYDDYAVQAFRSEAIDYITKPIDIDDLVAAVNKLYSKKQKGSMDGLKQKLAEEMKNHVIFSTPEGRVVFSHENIIRFEAFGNYVKLFSTENLKPILIAHTLKEIESIVPDSFFFRIHKSHIICLSHIKEFMKGRSFKLLMIDGGLVDVSMRKKAELMNRILD